MKKRTDVPVWLRIVLPIVIILVWFGGAGVGGPFFGKIDEVSSVDLTAFLPESAEATKVSKESKNFLSEDTVSAVVVFEATDESVSATDKKAIDTAREDMKAVEGVKGDIAPVIISDDKKAAFVSVPIDSKSKLDEVVEQLKTAVDGDVADTKVYVTGPAGFSADLNVAFAGIDGILLLVALAVVFLILVIVYRSPLLPFIVLMTSMFALTVSVLIVWNLANADIVTLNGQVQGILFILVIGAATDYSLLYVARYREELHRHKSAVDATRAAWKASVEPILASGGTVIAGLMCLIISDLASNKALGPVGSIGVAMALISALTFLPSVLILLGRASFWPFRPKYDAFHKAKSLVGYHKGIWSKVGDFVKAQPRRIWVVSSLVLLVAASGVFQLKADGVPQSELIIGYSEAREGQEVLGDHFPSGSGSPALVIAPASKQNEIIAALDGDKGVSSVAVVGKDADNPFVPVGKAEDDIRNDIRKGIETRLAKSPVKPDASAVEKLVDQAYPFKNAEEKVVNDRILLQTTLTDEPDSDAAKDTVVRLRETVHAIDASTDVGGITAAQYDSNETSKHDRLVIIPLVLLVITIILMVLLRAVVAPILLLLSTVLSFAATLGIAAYLFNGVLGLPGADPSVVLYGFVFLVALGIDYNIFLMTRVREESLRHGTQKGVITGLVVTGGVITSAGVVLAATFAALGVIPILFLGQLAFIVAFGVLLDTIVIRSLLVPALIKDIGSFVWWPSKLKK